MTILDHPPQCSMAELQARADRLRGVAKRQREQLPVVLPPNRGLKTTAEVLPKVLADLGIDPESVLGKGEE